MKKIYLKPETQQATLVGVFGICQSTAVGDNNQSGDPSYVGPPPAPGRKPF